MSEEKNIGHRAPAGPSIGKIFGTLGDRRCETVVNIEKQCRDYMHMEENYRRKRCGQIAIHWLKTRGTRTDHVVEKEWFELSICPKTGTLMIGNLYTLATLFGEAIKPWEWTSPDSYEGQYGRYEYRKIARDYRCRIFDNNEILTYKPIPRII